MTHLFPEWTGLLHEAETVFPIHAMDGRAFDAWASKAAPAARLAARSQGFQGKAGQTVVVPDGDGVAALVGWEPGADPLSVGAPAGKLSGGVWNWASEPEGVAPHFLALGWAAGSYRFTRYKARGTKPPRLLLPEGVDHARLDADAEAIRLAQDLVNTPAEDMGPPELEEAARDLAEIHGARVHVVTGEALLERGFPLIHAVGRAAAKAPRLIDLTWGDPDAPKITLVGKGVCFDSGGLDVKPADGMRNMKKDMGGAAQALACAHMVMSAGLDIRLRVLIPAVENAISGSAFRPGDIFKSRKGLTVEIGHTDAEGRLVLADALALADEEAPRLLIDFATLTGAARIALGPDLPPLYTNDEPLAGAIVRAAAERADPVWRMPLWRGYEPWIASPVADVSNMASSPQAGSITAALFLRKFVENARAWAHLDVYAWRDRAAPGRPQGGALTGARAVAGAIEAYAKADALKR